MLHANSICFTHNELTSIYMYWFSDSFFTVILSPFDIRGSSVVGLTNLKSMLSISSLNGIEIYNSKRFDNELYIDSSYSFISIRNTGLFNN